MSALLELYEPHISICCHISLVTLSVTVASGACPFTVYVAASVAFGMGQLAHTLSFTMPPPPPPPQPELVLLELLLVELALLLLELMPLELLLLLLELLLLLVASPPSGVSSLVIGGFQSHALNARSAAHPKMRPYFFVATMLLPLKRITRLHVTLHEAPDTAKKAAAPMIATTPPSQTLPRANFLQHISCYSVSHADTLTRRHAHARISRDMTMDAAPLPGTILLDKYRVEQVLGQGGMGVVVAARHVHLGELFAIKLMLPSALGHTEAIARFVREARASARLKGEHVARVHDAGSLADGAPFMVMEHLAGDDLKHVLKKRGPFPFDEAAFFVHQACEAVAEAHENGIVHRDLKPANMFLIRRPNGTPCVKVLDFGISKELDPMNKVGPDLTKPGTFMGSPRYMSPEQMASVQTTDQRSDIWALGIILYEFVIGKPPFLADAMTELVTKVLTTQPIPPSHLRPGIPPEFDSVVLRCLEKKPECRFGSVRELMVALEPFTTAKMTKPVIAVQPTAPSPRVATQQDPPTIIVPNHAEAPQSSAATVPLAMADHPDRGDESEAATIVIAPPLADHPDRGGESEAATMLIAPTQASQTGEAWSNTRTVLARKGKNTFVVAGVAIGAIALIGGGTFVATRSTPTTSTIATGVSIVPSAVKPVPIAIVEPTATPTRESKPAEESVPTVGSHRPPPVATTLHPPSVKPPRTTPTLTTRPTASTTGSSIPDRDK